MKDLGLINPRNVTDEEASAYKIRIAARAVVVDSDKKIALLHITRDNDYKLPGGGIEENEEMQIGLKRECREEIGCDIEVVDEIGTTIEYWKEDLEKQISHCFLANLIGRKGIPELTESEKIRGFETVWLTYDEAISTLKDSIPSQWEGEYIVPRELLFLDEIRGRFI